MPVPDIHTFYALAVAGVVGVFLNFFYNYWWFPRHRAQTPIDHLEEQIGELTARLFTLEEKKEDKTLTKLVPLDEVRPLDKVEP